MESLMWTARKKEGSEKGKEYYWKEPPPFYPIQIFLNT